jgi:hypothetical protein
LSSVEHVQNLRRSSAAQPHRDRSKYTRPTPDILKKIAELWLNEDFRENQISEAHCDHDPDE